MSAQSEPSDEELARQIAEMVGSTVQPLFDGINSFMAAPTERAAMQVLEQHPDLRGEQAQKIIKNGIEDARNQGHAKDADNMDERLRLLKRQG